MKKGARKKRHGKRAWKKGHGNRGMEKLCCLSVCVPPHARLSAGRAVAAPSRGSEQEDGERGDCGHDEHMRLEGDRLLNA